LPQRSCSSRLRAPYSNDRVVGLAGLQASTHRLTQSTSHEGGHDLRPQHWKEHACRWSFAAHTFSWAVPAEAHASMATTQTIAIIVNLEQIDIATPQHQPADTCPAYAQPYQPIVPTIRHERMA
jgi:hypothetical protein